MKKPTSNKTALRWVHWAIIALSSLLTVFAWYFSSSQLEEKTQERFDRAAVQAVDLVVERMQKYEDGLLGGVGAIHALGGSATEEQWLRFANTLNLNVRYPGVNGIGVILDVPPDELAAHIEEQRLSRPDYRVHPKHSKGEYWPITFIEPVDMNRAAVGLDIAHEVNRLTSAKKARDTGSAQITGPIVLVQDAEKAPGFLFYAPFYRKPDLAGTFGGLVYAPFVVKKLMAGVLAYERRMVGLRLLDGDEVLYDELVPTAADHDPSPLYQRSFEKEMYGRKWTFDIHSSLSFRKAQTSSQPMMILVAGLTIDLLLLWAFFVLSRANTKLGEEIAQRSAAESQLKAANDDAESRAEELRSSREWLRLMIEMAPNGVIMLDHDYNIILANPWCEATFERTSGELIGQHIDALVPLGEHLSELGEVITQNLELEGSGKHGRQVPLNISFCGLAIKGETRILITLIDNSQHKRNELEMALANERLMHSNQELEQFAFVASHDLQEPLRKVASFCELLEDEYGDKLDDEGRLYISYAVNGSQRMKKLIGDLLSYSRIQTQDQPPVEVEPGEVLEEVLNNLSGLLDDSQVEVTCQPSMPTVLIDRQALLQVFQNLVGNGLKYHRSERPRQIHVSMESVQGAHIFSVADNGIGIEPRYHDRIFGIFKRLHNRAEYEGTGIGLAICKRIVRRAGGQIWVESESGVGSTFFFSIPSTPGTQLPASFRARATKPKGSAT